MHKLTNLHPQTEQQQFNSIWYPHGGVKPAWREKSKSSVLPVGVAHCYGDYHIQGTDCNGKFQAWDLVRGAENEEIERETEENRELVAIKFEQPIPLIKKQQPHSPQLPFTPTKPPTSYFHSHSQYSSSGPKPRPKQKGLRRLSAKAFKIVKQLGSATYKQVAAKLIQLMDQESDHDEEVLLFVIQYRKEENNIKRRVYDALNVLIAMDILQKKGRYIVYDHMSEVARQQGLYLESLDTKIRLIESMRDKADQIYKKRHQIQKIQQKIQKIKQLLLRNKKLQRCHNREQKIKIPFVCLIVDSTTGIMDNIDLCQNNTQFQLSSNRNYSFIGDADFIVKHPFGFT